MQKSLEFLDKNSFKLFILKLFNVTITIILLLYFKIIIILIPLTYFFDTLVNE